MNILLILQACQCRAHQRTWAVCITGSCSWQTVISPVMLAAAILAALCGLMPCCVNSLTLLLTLFTAWGGGTNKEPGKHWHQSSQGDR